MDENMELQTPVEETAVVNALELNEKEWELVQSLASRIDIANPQHVQLFGAAACEKLASFSEEVLAAARPSQTEILSRKISTLMTELKACFTAQKGKGGLKNLFVSAAKKQEELRAQFEKLNKNVDSVLEDLLAKQMSLNESLAQYDQLHEQMQSLYRMFTVYIEAGKQRLRRERETTLASMRVIARRTGISRDAQNVKAFEESCQKFEQKIHDLEETRAICLQIEPEILLLSKQGAALALQLQNVLELSAVAWKSQTAAAMGAAQVEKAPALVDTEAIKDANRALTTSLDALLQTQAVSLQRHKAAEQKLQSIELHQRMKMLETEN